MATIELEYPIEGCTYKAGEVSVAIACCLLSAHTAKHMPTMAPQQPASSPAMPAPRGPKLDCPNVDLGVTQEQWKIFKRQWKAFVVRTSIDPDASSTHAASTMCQ